MERMYCLYTTVRVSLCCPNVVLVNCRNVLSLGLHFVMMFCTCGAKDMDVLYVIPSILVSGACGIVVPFSVTVGLYWCSLL